MCRCRTVSVHSLALSSSMSNRFHALFHAPSWRVSNPRSRRRRPPPAGRRGGSPRSPGPGRCRALRPSPRSPGAPAPARAQLVGDEPGFLDQPAVGLDDRAVAQQPGAGRQGDPHVRLAWSRPADRSSPRRPRPDPAPVRWRPFRSRYRLTPALTTRPSSPEETSSVPDQFSAVNVGLQAGEMLVLQLTNRRCDHLVRRPSGVLPGQLAG